MVMLTLTLHIWLEMNKMRTLKCLFVSITMLFFFVACMDGLFEPQPGEVDIDGPAVVEVGRTIDLTNNSVDVDVSYSSSDTNIATVNTNGVVTGVSRGDVTITATSVFDSSQMDTHNVRVIMPSVDSVNLSGPSNVEVGQTIQLTSTVTVQGSASDDVTYGISDTNIATVDTNGVVTGVSRGDVTITATSVFDSSQMDTHNVRVIMPSVDSINLSGPSNVEVGQTIQLTNTVVVTDGASDDVTYSSSDTSKATIDTNGVVTGVSRGNVTITATSVFDSSQMDTHSVRVIMSSVDSINLSGPSNVEVGQTIQLTSAVVIIDGASDDVTYSSSDTSKATIDTNGVVTGVSRGNVTITATSVFDSSQMDTHNVRVIMPSVDSVNLSGLSNVEVGQTIQLTSAVVVTDDASDDVTYSSSDTSKATVNANGVVTGVSRGDVTITATSVFDSSQMDTHSVRVIMSSVDSVNLSGLSNVEVGQTIQLTSAVVVTDDASDDVTYSSSDTSKATVNANGVVTGVSRGNVTITATSVFDSSQMDTHSVRVIMPSVDSINLSGLSNVEVGQTIQLTSAVVVTDGASDDVTYSSSDTSKATVNTNGVVTGVSRGNVTITATSVFDSSQMDTHNVRVIMSSVDSINLSGLSNVEVGQTIQLTSAVVVTDDASDDVTYSSSDTSKATVDTNGVVTGVSRGNVTITATSVFDSSQMDTHNVRVIMPSVDSVNLSGLSNVEVGQAIQLTSAVVVIDGASDDVTYSSSDTSKATVNANGVVTGVAGGNVTITATSVFDSSQMDTHNVTITLISVDSLNYGGNSFSYTFGTAITPLSATLTPSSAAGNVSFSGNLPAGLSLNPSNGTISGSPTLVMATANYTITATANPNSTSHTGSAQAILSIEVMEFMVHGYRLMASVPNIGSRSGAIVIQGTELSIFDGSSTTDLLAGVTPTGSQAGGANSGQTSLANFNNGSEVIRSVGGGEVVYTSLQDSSVKRVNVLRNSSITAASGVFRVRIVGRNVKQNANNGIVVTLLGPNGNPIGVASAPSTGFQDNNINHDGFEVWFSATNGSVLQQPRIFGSNELPVVAQPVADFSFLPNSSNSIDVSTVFADINVADGVGAFSYSASSSSPGVLRTSLSGSSLALVSASNEGSASITVTANDGSGGTVIDVFTVTVSNIMLPFEVYGYRLDFITNTATPLSSTFNGSEGDIRDGNSTTDLLAGVTPTSSVSPFFGNITRFNDGADSDFNGVEFFDFSGNGVSVQVLGTSQLMASSGIFRVRVSLLRRNRHQNNGIRVSLLDIFGNVIPGSTSEPTSGLLNQEDHDGFVVDFRASDGEVLAQPRIFKYGSLPSLPSTNE